MRSLALLVLPLAFVCCTPTGVDDDQPDPAEAGDAGHLTDAGTQSDAGPVRDAGEEVEPDAGTDGEPDAGVPPTSMALSAQDGRFVRVDGAVVDVRGAISCCGGGYGWPLFDEAWSALVADNDGNFLHARLGPFLTAGNGETDWAATGGGYLEVDGRADLAQFNDAFWARVRALVQLARDHGQYVEIDVVDGWSIKHCQAGDIPGYSAWDAAFNVQGLDLCSAAGSEPVAPGSVHEAWIRKVVLETGRFDNVLYQDGNEVSLIAGYTAEWTRSMHDLIRDEEQRHGYLRHPFGTNAGEDAAMQLAEVDYLEFHQTQAPSAAQCLGKPCMVNEYNPSPALTPAQFEQRFCAARTQGTAFWYWRHEQTEAQLHESLAVLGEQCSEPSAAAFPVGVPEEGFIAAATSSTDTDPEVDAAVNAAMVALTGCGVSSSCDLSAFAGANAEEKCQSWFAAVTAELRARGYSAGQHEVGHTDEIAVSNTGCAGRWYGYHVCNYGGPLVVWSPGARRGWWMIDPGYCQ
ncbi:MAG: hypothetical protein HYS27_01060 [Deltaproteobacteria bacterium]|nr:hypothetical protein [Deltaproteobacteria bacterium]